jgi:hypothetical protein
MSCAASNLWFGLWAPWDGGTKGGELGWRIAPRFGFWGDLLTGWFFPFLFAGVCGSIGAALGGFAFSGSLFEAGAQLFLREPYKRPISRMLIDWIPE